MIDGLSAHLLGRHVADRADDDARLGVGVVASSSRPPLDGSDAREAEVEDLQPAVVGHEQVLGLEIAMDDALVVRGSEPSRDLDARSRWPCAAAAVPTASAPASVSPSSSSVTA